MPSAAQSPASSAAHRNVTAVLGIIDALSMEVTVCGDRCALYLQTATGQMIVRLPAARFVAVARADRDSNGKPFPALAASSRELKLRQLEADADATRSSVSRFSPLAPVAPLAAPAPALDDGVTVPLAPAKAAKPLPKAVAVEVVAPPAPPAALAAMKPLSFYDGDNTARDQALRAAWEVFISTPDTTVWNMAQQLMVRASWLRSRFEAFSAEPGAPVLKPNGKL